MGDQGLHSSKNSTRSPREITLILHLYLIVHKPLLSWFCWISFDYRVTLGFGSIAGGLDHVNPVIRLSIEHWISRVLGFVSVQDEHYEQVEETTRRLDMYGDVQLCWNGFRAIQGNAHDELRRLGALLRHAVSSSYRAKLQGK
ncbi:hypothetical protein Tco_1155882 [Tanacetum coccineum]